MSAKNDFRWTKGAWLSIFAIFLSGTLTPFQAISASGNERQEATQIIENACITLSRLMTDKNMGAFRNLFKDAKAVVIAPEFLKGAFLVGASGGNALAMVRDEKTKKWSQPAFYTIGGASIGLQIGGQSSEVILLAMTQRGVASLLGDSFKLGVDAGIAVGPFGLGAEAATVNLSADILSFSRSKGLYGGMSLDGAVVAVREPLNEAYYAEKVSPTDILVRHKVENPDTVCLLEGLKQAAEIKAMPLL